jgi:hypothetical protein
MNDPYDLHARLYDIQSCLENYTVSMGPFSLLPVISFPCGLEPYYSSLPIANRMPRVSAMIRPKSCEMTYITKSLWT